MTLKLIETGVNFTVVDLPRAFTDRLEQKRLRIELGINTEDIKDDTRSCAIVTGTNDVSVTDEEHKLSLIIVVESGKRIDRTTQGLFTLSVTGNLTDDEFVQHFGITLRGELERSKD